MATKKKEESLQLAVCNYLKLQYPDAIWSSESSGIRLTMGQAVKAKRLRSDAKLPDLWVLHPRGGYHGMLIELKKESPYYKGTETLKKDPHLHAQNEMLARLRAKGYNAFFVWDFDTAKQQIDTYMKYNPE